MKYKTPIRPPKTATRFLRWFCHPDFVEDIEGDLEELFLERVSTRGKRYAGWFYLLDVLLLLRPSIIRTFFDLYPFTLKHQSKNSFHLSSVNMFTNYLKIGWRNLLRGKAYSLINITGLAVGMTVAILLGLWISDELAFNSYFKNDTHLAQVMLNQTQEGITYTGGTISVLVADPLRNQHGDSFKAVSLVSFTNSHLLAFGEKKLSGNGLWVEPDFPEMFTLSILHGSRDALRDPSTLLLSQSMATALFGDENPVNKTLRIDNDLDMTVGGVYEDLPHNTTFFSTKLLLPWANKANFGNRITTWKNHNARLFVQLADNKLIGQVNENVKGLPTPYIEEWKEEIMLYPMDRLHLYNEFENGKATGGKIQFVVLFGVIGGFVLLLACINFMNLSTARSEKRSREVGIRKTVGSGRKQLINQFLVESIMVAGIAMVLSILFAQLSLPFFNSLADKKIAIPWTGADFWAMILGFTMFSGLLSGCYPAFYLSSFRPVKVLKGSLRAGRHTIISRKVLVIIQFTVSITLIVGTLVIFRQIQFAKDRPAGYTRAGLISVFINTPEMRRHSEAIQHDLLQSGAVQNVALSSQSAAHFNNNTSIEWRGKDPGFVEFFRNVNVTPEFGKTIGWTIKEGRDFSGKFATDSGSVVLNETAIEMMGLENPLEETIKYREKDYQIVGIVKDMVTQSPFEPIEPTVFFMEGFVGVFTIRLQQNVPAGDALSRIGQIFKKYNPDAPFNYSYVDQAFDRKFSSEKHVGNLAGLFTMLAIFISLLGLIGLASFVAEQRTKEISIRKVLGASVLDVWKMLSTDFLILVGLSGLIAVPIAYYFLHGWLQQYEYRTEISWWIFALAGLGGLFLTLLTVSFQAIKAAVTDPVKSLRSA